MDQFSKLIKMKTLLVDDNELIRDALRLAFMNNGCFLQAFETAEEGLRTLEKESFNIIISDFKLPGIDGLEFLRLANVYQPNTVKVLITACGFDDVATQASSIGVNGYFEKPFIIKKLIKSLALLVENHNAIKRNHG
jgi:DNA-binding NtrC family response regulator